MAQSERIPVDLEADDEVDVMLNPSPEVVEVQEALLRSYTSKEALVRSLKEEKPFQSPSSHSSPELVDNRSEQIGQEHLDRWPRRISKEETSKTGTIFKAMITDMTLRCIGMTETKKDKGKER